MRLFATRHRDDFPPRPAATRRAATRSHSCSVPQDFCSLFLHHLFPRTPRASPITCLFTDCIHLATADARRMSRIKISSRLPGCGGWQKVARLTPTHLFSLLNSAAPLDSSLLIPADLPSCERNGQDGIMSATSQGLAKVERWAPERASELPSISREMLISPPAWSPAPLAFRSSCRCYCSAHRHRDSFGNEQNATCRVSFVFEPNRFRRHTSRHLWTIVRWAREDGDEELPKEHTMRENTENYSEIIF